MKPTSIIFLVVSLVIILVGWIICGAAESSAEADGVQIFDSTITSDKNTVNTVTFGSEDIYNKIEIVADDADVYIYGGYSEPYMELVNFKDGSYRMTMTNRIINVDTTIDLMSVIKFWESGFSFRGLRNYLHRSDSAAEASRRINLYLPSDGDVNVINVTLDSGSVYVSNFETQIDVNLTLGKGNAVFTSFITDSQISAEINSGDIYLRDVESGIFRAVMYDGDITAQNFKFRDVNIVGSTTSVSLLLMADMGDFTMNLSARHGNINLFGESRGHELRQESNTSASALVTVTSGDIIIERGEAVHKPTTGTDETSGETDTTEPEGIE